MAKQAKKAATPQEDNVNHAGLIVAELAATERGEKYLAIAQQFNYTLPYNLDRMVDEVQHYMGESARTMLESGARLALIRSQSTHGEWLQTCERLGLEIRTAQRMIQSAHKFASNATPASHFGRIGSAKLFELLTLDDDEVETLRVGGALEGVGTLDEIECMSRRELRDNLREAREINNAKDTLLTEQSTAITTLQAKKKLLKPPTPDENMKALRREMSDVVADCEAKIRGTLRDGISQLRDGAEVTEGDENPFILGLLAQLQKAIIDTADSYGLLLPEIIKNVPWDGDDPDEDNDDEQDAQGRTD